MRLLLFLLYKGHIYSLEPRRVDASSNTGYSAAPDRHEDIGISGGERVEECQSEGKIRTLPTASARKWEYLEVIAKAVEHDDRIVTCVPIVSDASLCLIVFRDCGDDVFGAHAVTFGVYYRNHENAVVCTISVDLLKGKMKDSEWVKSLRTACENRCGDPNKIFNLRTFVELRNEIQGVEEAHI